MHGTNRLIHRFRLKLIFDSFMKSWWALQLSLGLGSFNDRFAQDQTHFLGFFRYVHKYTRRQCSTCFYRRYPSNLLLQLENLGFCGHSRNYETKSFGCRCREYNQFSFLCIRWCRRTATLLSSEEKIGLWELLT
jgi:hypothetical protein